MPAPIVGRTMMAAANLLPVLLFCSWGHAAASDSQPQDKYVNDYFRTLVWSPPVLGGRLQGKSSVYTSKDLEKIDRELDKAREEYMLLKQRWNVSIALGGFSLDDEKLEDAYKDAFRKSLKPLVQDLRPGLPSSAYPYYAKEVQKLLSLSVAQKEKLTQRVQGGRGRGSTKRTAEALAVKHVLPRLDMTSAKVLRWTASNGSQPVVAICSVLLMGCMVVLMVRLRSQPQSTRKEILGYSPTTPMDSEFSNV